MKKTFSMKRNDSGRSLKTLLFTTTASFLIALVLNLISTGFHSHGLMGETALAQSRHPSAPTATSSASAKSVPPAASKPSPAPVARITPAAAPKNASTSAASASQPIVATKTYYIPYATDSIFWRNAQESVYKTVPELLAQQQKERSKGIRFRKFVHGDEDKKLIALTFDDGPHPEYTPKILEILKKYNVKATFFVVGMMAEKNPELIRMEVKDGHQIGNHTYHHVNLTKIPTLNVAIEMKACGEVIRAITGKPIHIFRPPGGDYNNKTAVISEILGYTMVLWTDNPGDYEKPGGKTIQNRTLNKISNGGIILLHDGVQQTIDVLPSIITGLQKEGYKLVTVDELIDSVGEPNQKNISRHGKKHKYLFHSHSHRGLRTFNSIHR